MLKVLGIDPGMQRMGLSLVCLDTNEILSYNSAQILSTIRKPDEKFNNYLNRGIHNLANEFPVILSTTNPHLIVSETVPSGRLGSNTELVVAAITTCKVIAYQWDIPWTDIPANTVKKLITNDGTATKAKIRNAVMAQFPKIKEKHEELKLASKESGERPARGLEQDIFDAIAVGIAGVIKLHGNSVRPYT